MGACEFVPRMRCTNACKPSYSPADGEPDGGEPNEWGAKTAAGEREEKFVAGVVGAESQDGNEWMGCGVENEGPEGRVLAAFGSGCEAIGVVGDDGT